jgi:hypothetical protein
MQSKCVGGDGEVMRHIIAARMIGNGMYAARKYLFQVPVWAHSGHAALLTGE